MKNCSFSTSGLRAAVAAKIATDKNLPDPAKVYLAALVAEIPDKFNAAAVDVHLVHLGPSTHIHISITGQTQAE